MKSFSFYIFLFILKRKGIKKIFGQTPFDYQKLREGNIHSPSKKDLRGLDCQTIQIGSACVTQISAAIAHTEKIMLYCPGGSFVSGPNGFNWKSLARIVKETGITGYLIDYPKAPEHQIDAMNQSIDAVYAHFAKRYGPDSITLLGGSVGGTLMALLVQRLLKNRQALPRQLVLITPLTDCSLSNPGIPPLESLDPMNAKPGWLAAHKMCAGSYNLKNELVSPLYGPIENFIPTMVLLAENDISRPDSELFCARLQAANVAVKVVYGKGMPHIYPLLPFAEGKKALGEIIAHLKSGN